jgi:hypothetical protein
MKSNDFRVRLLSASQFLGRSSSVILDGWTLNPEWSFDPAGKDGSEHRASQKIHWIFIIFPNSWPQIGGVNRTFRHTQRHNYLIYLSIYLSIDRSIDRSMHACMHTYIHTYLMDVLYITYIYIHIIWYIYDIYIHILYGIYMIYIHI